MFMNFTEGFLLGLSVGLTCLSTCGPIYFVFIIRRERTLSQSFRDLLQILLGRFVAYGIFGAAAGALGKNIPENMRNPITYTAFVILGAIMIYYALRGEKIFQRCPTYRLGRIVTHPLLLGFMTGLEICPPFVLAVVKAISLGGMLDGMMLFIGFFFATSLFLVPIAFFGVASSLKSIRIIASIIGVIIGIWFFLQGASGLTLEFMAGKPQNEYSIIGAREAKNIWIFVDNGCGESLSREIENVIKRRTEIVATNAAESIAAIADTTDMAIWISKHDGIDIISRKIGVVFVDGEMDSSSFRKLANFLNTYYFKKSFGKGFVFHWEPDDS